MTLKLSMSAKITASVAAALERAGEQRVEAGAVREPGQRIVVRLVIQALGVVLAGGDVDALGDVVVGLPGGVADQRVAPQEPADAAVGTHERRSTSGASGAGGQLCASAMRSCSGTKSQNSSPSGRAWPVRSRSSRLACSTLPRGETSAIATGASSNARRKRSSEASVAARPRSLARQ